MDWFNAMKGLIPANAQLVHRELFESGEYSKEVLVEKKNYQLVIIDGEDRNNCLIFSLLTLSDDGVIVYDNTDRDDYLLSYNLLEKSGFKRIDFIGLAPIVNVNSCTSIFYRQHNCLGI